MTGRQIATIYIVWFFIAVGINLVLWVAGVDWLMRSVMTCLLGVVGGIEMSRFLRRRG